MESDLEVVEFLKMVGNYLIFNKLNNLIGISFNQSIEENKCTMEFN